MYVQYVQYVIYISLQQCIDVDADNAIRIEDRMIEIMIRSYTPKYKLHPQIFFS